MAKRKTSKSAASAPAKRRVSRARTIYRGARTASRKSGMRWGEVALAALVGYEGDKVISSSGVGTVVYNLMQKNAYTAEITNELQNSDKYTSLGEVGGAAANKIAGLAAILKGAYDVVKHNKLSESDKNILIPYGIGTVFDGPSGKSESGGWK